MFSIKRLVINGFGTNGPTAIIRIIVPGPVMDSKGVQSASRSLRGALLDAGVESFENQPMMYLCKEP